jgi:hypothetical protein
MGVEAAMEPPGGVSHRTVEQEEQPETGAGFIEGGRMHHDGEYF